MRLTRPDLQHTFLPSRWQIILLLPVLVCLLLAGLIATSVGAEPQAPAPQASPTPPPPCVFPLDAATETELDFAIDCFNAVTTAGSYTISITGDISLITNTHTISNATAGVDLQIAGNGNTLDGQGAARSGFAVAQDTRVTIRNLSMVNGMLPLGEGGEFGGAILNDGGDVTVTDSTLSSNQAAAGGAVASTGGSLTINGTTTLGNNFANLGGAVANLGLLTIDGTTLRDNSADPLEGGAIYTIAPLTLTNATLLSNTTTAAGGGLWSNSTTVIIGTTIISNTAGGNGGGVHVESSGSAEIVGTEIVGNSADQGGGIYNQDTLTLTNSTVNENVAEFGGAGLFLLAGTTEINNTQIISNTSESGAGGGIANDSNDPNALGGTLIIRNSEVSSNTVTTNSGGGGIYNYNGDVTLIDSAVNNNSAPVTSGIYSTGSADAPASLTILRSTIADNMGGWTGGIESRGFGATHISDSLIRGNSGTDYGGFKNFATATLTNTTISGNTAGPVAEDDARRVENALGGGVAVGGIFNFNAMTLTHVTIVGNGSADVGCCNDQFVGGLAAFNGTMTVRNSLIAENTASTDNPSYSEHPACLIDSRATFVASGDSIADDAECTDFTIVADVQVVDELADNGGNTQTHALQAASPAIDLGDSATCAATDQRGVARPTDGNGDAVAQCDAGAYEAPAVPAANFYIDDAQVVEGDSGTVEMTFNITRSSSILTSTVVVSTTDDTATDGVDYVGRSQTITFPIGTLTQLVTVTVSGDTVIEQDETVTATLSNVVNGVIADDSAVGTILNDDAAVITIGDVTVNENVGSATLVVTQSAEIQPYAVTFGTSDPINIAANQTVTPYPSELIVSGLPSSLNDVNVRLDGLAHAALRDISILLQSPSGTYVSILNRRGQDFVNVNVDVLFDDEASNPPLQSTAPVSSGTYRPSGAKCTDPFSAPVPSQPNCNTTPAVQWETALSALDGEDPNGTWKLYIHDQFNGDGGSLAGWALEFDGIVATITDTYTLSDGTAVAADDYINTSGIVTFTNGVTQTSLSVPIVDDLIAEATEAFTVTLGSGDAAMVTINDEDDEAGFTIDRTLLQDEGDSGATTFEFEVSRTGFNSGEELSYTVAPDMSDPTFAAEATDFVGDVFPSGDVDFGGNLTTTIVISVSGDLTVEATDRFVVTLSERTRGLTITQATATGSIVNDDIPTGTVSDVTVDESVGTAVLTMTLDRPFEAGSTHVYYSTVEDSATEDDYERRFYTRFPFGSGGITQTVAITIPIVDDALVEGDETFTVTVETSNFFFDETGRGGLNPFDTATVTIVDNDDVAPAVVSSDPVTGAVDVALDATLTLTFSEAVSVTTGVTLTCDGVGQSIALTMSGPNLLDITPASDLPGGEACTLTVPADSVTDDDAIDPPDGLSADFTLTFTTAIADPTASTTLLITAFTYQADTSDGVPDGNLDGFIIIKNVSSSPISLDGYKLGDEETRGGDEGMFALPNVMLGAGESLIIAEDADEYAAGTPAHYSFAANSAGVPTLTAYSTWSVGAVDLDNVSDEVVLLSPADELVDGACYGSVGTPCLFDTTARAQTHILDDGRLADGDFAGFARNDDVDTNTRDDWALRATAVGLSLVSAETAYQPIWAFLILATMLAASFLFLRRKGATKQSVCKFPRFD